MSDQDELIAGCFRLVRSLARQYASCCDGASIEDLESEGYLGLVQAAKKFQPNRGVHFRTFAAPRIRGAMLDLLRRESPLSRPMASNLARLRSEQDSLYQRLGREPTQDELARRLRLPAAKAGEVIAFRSLRVVSLETQDEDVSSVLTDGRASPENLAIREAVIRELQKYLMRLLPQDREIIERIYWHGQKQIEVATAMGMSPSRVSQRRARALKRLRKMIAADGRQAEHYLRAA